MTDSHVLLHHVDDYAPSGLEFAEIKTRLLSTLDEPERVTIHDLSVPSLDTIALGFATAQLALAPYQGRMVVYGNCAPRRTSDKARHNNKDHGIRYVRLDNNVEVINVYSEFAFGFLKDRIVDYRVINCPSEGSQFRSRDYFPVEVAKIINGDRENLGQQLEIESIPDIPNNLVAWTDGFGNVKTTMRRSDLQQMGLNPGDKVQVILNDVSMMGVVSVGGFQVDRGVLAINSGSSGFDNPFIEFFLRVHHIHEKTAAVRFNHPIGGTEFEIKPL